MISRPIFHNQLTCEHNGFGLGSMQLKLDGSGGLRGHFHPSLAYFPNGGGYFEAIFVILLVFEFIEVVEIE